MRTVFRIAAKEFGSFFASPIAYIFMGVFLAASLFIFFWVETFFSANIAEVRPLFSWMPVLLIFLASAITMRLWAEERRSGTLELLLTAPVAPVALVMGKFLACMILVAISLGLTLPLPVTVSFMGPLDWGPVFGGYVATLFLAAAYISIGLFVSARTDNQIVSLIVSSLVCFLFYLTGSDTLASFFGNRGAEVLHLLGTGSRFQSITRGVIDARDLYYYIAIMGVFLSLNIYGLEKIRWADNPASAKHRRWLVATGLVMANFIAANFWLAPVTALRTDLTDGRIYSISGTTRNYLAQLREPLLIRGYFSAQTHPLLAPLVPRLRDLLEEYAVAGGSKVHVEFIDPAEHPELEQEAGQKYGIRPVPFQTSSKYQAAVTNSYFDLLIQYGDQYETLGFKDLIEVKVPGEQQLAVELRNPEYDITRAIKKVMYNYQGGGDLFTSIGKSIQFTGYMSADSALPEELVKLKKNLHELLAAMKNEGGDKFSFGFVDPADGDGAVAEKLTTQYGFKPMALSLFDDKTFWYYMTLTSGDRMVEVPLPEDLSKDGLKRALDAGVKRFATGFTKTVALVTPQSTPPMPQYGMQASGPQFNALREVLGKDHTVTPADLAKGRVSEEADLLMVVSPEDVDQKKLYAMDQFLMQGGTVVIAASPFSVNLQGGLAIEKKATGLEEWLQSYGISIEQQMVLDPRNSAFPVPVQRQVAGFTVEETHLVNYPYFIDIRPDGMDKTSGLMTGVKQLTMNWASPVEVDKDKNKDRKVTRLVESSKESWLSPSTDINPDFATYKDYGFATGKEQKRHLLAVAVEGRFNSYFAGKPSPLLVKEEKAAKPEEPVKPEDKDKKKEPVISRQLDHSPESARIIVFGSGSFLSDTLLGIGSTVMRTNYLEPVQLMANAIDWSLEDRGLLSIRGRGHFSRTLYPMSRQTQMFLEYLNYGFALAGLLVVWFIRRMVGRRSQAHYLAMLQEG